MARLKREMGHSSTVSSQLAFLLTDNQGERARFLFERLKQTLPSELMSSGKHNLDNLFGAPSRLL